MLKKWIWRYKFYDIPIKMYETWKKPIGLISMLEDGSNSSKATGVRFTNKIKLQLSSNSCFSVAKQAFKVHHFVGDVLLLLL